MSWLRTFRQKFGPTNGDRSSDRVPSPLNLDIRQRKAGSWQWKSLLPMWNTKAASLAVVFAREQATVVELRQALEQEKESSFLRACFVSMVYHELRNPLNVVSFSTSLLRRHGHQWIESKKRPYFAHIQTAIEQIRQLLDELLKHQSGRSRKTQVRAHTTRSGFILLCSSSTNANDHQQQQTQNHFC